MSEEIIVEEEMEITPVSAQGVAIMSYTDRIMSDVAEQGYWASFDVETMEDKKVLYRARNDNELLRDHMGEVISMFGLVVDTQVINDPKYGSKRVPCAHIMAEDGTCYQSSSMGVVDSACGIISTFGMPETWGGPIEVVCKETTTNQGFRYKYISVV